MSDSYCGINCEECPVFNLKYTQKQKNYGLVAGSWSSALNTKISKKELHCDGCKSQNRFVHCRDCDIETCCKEKGVENCSTCSEQDNCSHLISFHEWFEQNKIFMMWNKIKKNE